jgi:hypothetical protein
MIANDIRPSRTLTPNSPSAGITYELGIFHGIAEVDCHGVPRPAANRVPILVAQSAVLLVAWLLGLGVFHVAGVFIHILLILAVVALAMHFVRGRTKTA